MWALPGGATELGGSLAVRAIRETREGTGLTVEITGVVGTYSDPTHVFAHDDGEVRQEFSVCLLARPVSGTPAASNEPHEVRWFRPEELDALPMVNALRKRVDAWRHGAAPAVR